MRQLCFNLNNRHNSKAYIIGITVIELLIVLAVLGVISVIAVPAYQDYGKRVEADQTIKDLVILQLKIDDYELNNSTFPASLADIGADGTEDPWGNSYIYANHDLISPGHRRKDHSLVPINSDYDLYSKGEDGRSVSPLTAQHSRDDIIRASDGRFIGKAEDY